MRDFTAPAAEVLFPEIDPSMADAVDAMLERLYALQYAEAMILGRKLVTATLSGDFDTRIALRRCERFLANYR